MHFRRVSPAPAELLSQLPRETRCVDAEKSFRRGNSNRKTRAAASKQSPRCPLEHQLDLPNLDRRVLQRILPKLVQPSDLSLLIPVIVLECRILLQGSRMEIRDNAGELISLNLHNEQPKLSVDRLTSTFRGSSRYFCTRQFRSLVDPFVAIDVGIR